MTGEVIADPDTGLPVLPDGYWWDIDGKIIAICEHRFAPPNFKLTSRVAHVFATTDDPGTVRAAALLLFGMVRVRLERESDD